MSTRSRSGTSVRLGGVDGCDSVVWTSSRRRRDTQPLHLQPGTAAIARLDLAFGAEDVSERQRFAECRLFRNASPADVGSAVARAIRYFSRRPNADELRQLLDDERHGRVDEADLTAPAQVPGRVAELRRQLEGEVVVRLETAGTVVAAVRDQDGVHDVVVADGCSSCSCQDSPSCSHTSVVRQVVTGAVLS